MSNHTWELAELPPKIKPIGCKWIFKRKLKLDGTIDKYKARLVAKGYRQKQNVDYFDTYSPVTRIASIRILFAVASIYKLVVHQMDVKTAFLNGDLEEEIYMEQPEGCVVLGQEHKVCKLVKSLYGLKQAPKQWHEKFDKVMLSNAYVINGVDKRIYSKFNNNEGVIICLYVDDLLIFGTSLDIVHDSKRFLGSNFDMKDMGEANVILGIKILRNDDCITLSQSHYIEKVLKRFEYFDLSPMSTPYDSKVHLVKNLGDSVSQERYAQIIGSLMFLTSCTRHDIAYAIGRLSRYTHNPSIEHWNAISRLLRYLKGTINFGLSYCDYPTVLEGYCDANWISDSDEVKPTSGYVFTLAGGTVSWKSSKQTCIARSTMEAELVALEKVRFEAEWLKSLLVDLPLYTNPVPPVCIHCDCQAAIARAKSKIYNGKSRHIRLRHNIVRQLIENGIISLDFVRSERNMANPLTKPLARKLVSETLRGIGLIPKL
jgi:hypothetical protein